MPDLSDLCVYTTERDGKWLAATNVSPYLCFEAASEQEVLAEAREALEFYAVFKSQPTVNLGEIEVANLSWHSQPARQLIAAE